MSILCSMVGASFAVAAAAEVIRKKKGIIAVGNAQIDTAQSKFGGSSAQFDGDGDLLTLDTGANLIISSGENFTIEGWVRPALVTDARGILTDRSSSLSLSGVNWDISIFNGSYLTTRTATLLFETGSGAGSIIIISNNNVFTTNTWYHFAVVRNNNVITLYVNGVDVTNNRAGTQSAAIGAGNLTIGGFSNNALTNQYSGHIDEIRWSNVARYTANFTPSTSPFVNDDNTLLLLHMNGTDASTFFEDDNGSVPSSSRTAKTLTVQGNAQVDTAQSKFGGASYLGDGTGDYLVSAANTDYNFGTSSFTIEFWVRFAAVGTLYVPIAQRTSAGIGNGEWWCEVTASERKMYWGFKNQAGTQYYVNLALAGTAFAANTWYHIALVNNAGTAQMYIDGVATGATTSLAGSFGNSTTDLWVGAGAGAYSLNGHLDEVRISNTARYTAAFTPATAAFSNDANTLLLLHMDGADASTTFTDDNIPATRSQVGLWGTGSAALSTTQSKFGLSSLRTLSANVTKIAFSSQPLDTINTGPFTIEMWYRPDSVAQTTKVLLFTNEGGANRRGLIVNNQTVKYAIGGTDQITTGNLLTSANTWYHIALVRGVNNTTTLYVDGVSGGTYAGDTLSLASTGNNTIAALASGFTPDGYIDEFRISKTARYTSAFTPPTSAFTNDSDTVMLLHFDGTDASTVFRDDNGQTPPRIPKHISYYGNAQIDTAQSKFGGASALFDGTGDYLLVNSDPAFAYGTGDYTIEFWVYNSAWATEFIFDQRTTGTQIVPAIYYDGGIKVYVNGSDIISGGTLTANAWHHIALVKSGSDHKLYYNGTQTGSTYSYGGTYVQGGNLTIGTRYAIDTSYSGWIDEFRISNTARYTANFTPSTTPFVNDANTLLLLHADGVDATTIFVDDAGQRSQKSIVSLNGAEIDTAQSKFGGSSLLMPNDGSKQLSVAHSPAFLTGTGPFCVEGWFRPLSAVDPGDGVGSRFFYFKGVNTAGGIGLGISTDGIRFRGPGTDDIAYTGTVSNSTFSHIAFVWDGTNKSIYLNGSRVATTTAQAINVTDTSNIVIGYNSIRFGYNGHIDELRHSNVARYSGTTYTQPTAAFQNDSNTLLLLHFDGTDGSTVFFDDNGRDTTPSA